MCSIKLDASKNNIVHFNFQKFSASKTYDSLFQNWYFWKKYYKVYNLQNRQFWSLKLAFCIFKIDPVLSCLLDVESFSCFPLSTLTILTVKLWHCWTTNLLLMSVKSDAFILQNVLCNLWKLTFLTFKSFIFWNCKTAIANLPSCRLWFNLKTHDPGCRYWRFWTQNCSLSTKIFVVFEIQKSKWMPRTFKTDASEFIISFLTAKSEVLHYETNISVP